MREDLLKILVAEIESHVAQLFENARVRAVAAGEKFATVPYLDDRFLVECESSHLQRTVCRALAPRESFRETAPHWAPELPLSSADCEKMIGGRSNKIALVGYFGRSWACANWGIHPTFRDYACGLMACEHTPEHIRNDPELLKEFHPRLLEGLDQSLCWNTIGRIFDFTQQLMRTEESWRTCGLADDAKWMRGVIEQLVGVKLDQKLRDALDRT